MTYPTNQWSNQRITQPGHLAWLGLSAVLATMAIFKYLALHTSYGDFGILLNNVYNIAHGEWQHLFSGHVSPLLALWAGFYLVFPESWVPLVLLTAQAVALAWPVSPLYREYGSKAALAYVLFFPLWFNALFDFHVDHAAFPLLMAFFLAERRGSVAGAVTAALLLSLIKEPFALQSAMCGVYLIWRQRWVMAGLGLVVYGLGWFIVATNWLLPAFTMSAHGALDDPAFSWLGNSLGEMAISLLTNPQLMLQEIFGTPGKIIYLVVLFGSLCFLPLLRPVTLLPLLPILMISLLSREPNYYGLGHQYTAGMAVPMVVATAEAMQSLNRISWLERWRRWLPNAIVITMIIAHVAVSPSPLGRLFWSNKVWSYHWQAYVQTDRDQEILRAIREYVPEGSEVNVSTQNTLNSAHLAFRRHYYSFPFSVGSGDVVPICESNGNQRAHFREESVHNARSCQVVADYVILDLHRPWYLHDRGCGWLYGACSDVSMARLFLARVSLTEKTYEKIYANDGFMILKRAP